MNELEELNAVQMEEVAGGALQIPNTVKVITSGGYTALHSTPEIRGFLYIRAADAGAP